MGSLKHFGAFEREREHEKSMRKAFAGFAVLVIESLTC